MISALAMLNPRVIHSTIKDQSTEKPELLSCPGFFLHAILWYDILSIRR